MTIFYYITFKPDSKHASKYVLIPADSKMQACDIAKKRYGNEAYQCTDELENLPNSSSLTRLMEFKLWRTG